MAANQYLDEVQEVLKTFHLAPDYQTHGSVFFTPLGEPSFVLKPLRIGAIRSYLTGKLLAEEALFGLVPRLVKTESGGYYQWERGNRYLLTEKLSGRVADYNSTKDLKVAIITMANFHRICHKIIQLEPNKWVFIRFNPLERWRKCLEEMVICRERAIRRANARCQEDFFSRQYIQMWHQFYEMAFQVLQELPNQSVSMGETICYHDWAFHNVIIQGDKAYLIDFDDMIIDHSIHDRVNLISRYLRLFHWSPRALLKILWLFDHFYSWQKGELQLLRLYLTFPYEYWMLGRQYYIEKQPWSLRYYRDQWQRKVSFHSERLKILDLIKNME
jgi:CotS family spore coat protein